jgi:glutaredoxin
MSYNIKIIFLENCDFSKKSLKLLQDNNIKYELVEIDHMNKDKFKTDIISTFPQIY